MTNNAIDEGEELGGAAVSLRHCFVISSPTLLTPYISTSYT